jgi:nucleoid-associated protein YgaU
MLTHALRCWGLLAIAAGSGVSLSIAAPPDRLATALRATARHPQSIVDAQGVESVAITVVATLAWIALAWLALAIVLVGAASAPGRLGTLATMVSAVLVPAATRRLIAAAIGVSLLSGAGAATAAPGAPPPPPTAISALDLDWPIGGTAPATGSSPTPPAGTSPPSTARPSTASPGAAPPGTTPPRGDSARDGAPGDAAPDEVVVLRGDSLWAIAARHLGPGATDEQIAREWPRWWAANRHVVGADPDQIKPGQRLAPPLTRRQSLELR